jgi:hypothetical protein
MLLHEVAHLLDDPASPNNPLIPDDGNGTSSRQSATNTETVKNACKSEIERL